MATAPVIFTRKGTQSFVLSIPSGRTKKEQDEANYLRRQARGSGFLFQHDSGSGLSDPVCYFTTDDDKVIAFIRKKAKENPRLRIKQDLSLMPLGCPYCDFKTGGNTAEDHEALSEHVAANHTGGDMVAETGQG